MKRTMFIAVMGISGVLLTQSLTACQREEMRTLQQSGVSGQEAEATQHTLEIFREDREPGDPDPAPETMQTTQGEQTSDSVSRKAKVGADEAQKEAISHAGVDREDIEFIRAELEKDGGDPRYDVEFSAAGKEYEYEISALDGSILEYSVNDEYENMDDKGRENK